MRVGQRGGLQVPLALLALLIAAGSGCGGGSAVSGGSGSPAAASASPSAAASDDSYALSSALDSFTFLTSTYEPEGDVAAQGALAPRVFVADLDRVDVDRRELTFDVVKLYQGEDAYRKAGGRVDNAIVYRNDIRHRQTLRLSPGVLPVSPRAGGVLTLEELAKLVHHQPCWMAVDGGRIVMCVPVGHP
jgi:hypothetical protein